MPPRTLVALGLSFAGFAGLAPAPARAQAPRPRLGALRIDQPIVLDGRLDEPAWRDAEVATDFTQRAWTLSYSKHGALVTGGGIQEQSTPYIWELAKAHGLKVMTFGMGNRRGVAEVRSTRFEQQILDPMVEQRPAGEQAPRLRDFMRADRFVEEFEEMDRRRHRR